MNYAAVQPPPPTTRHHSHMPKFVIFISAFSLSPFVRRYPSSASSPIILIMFNTVIIPVLHSFSAFIYPWKVVVVVSFVRLSGFT